MEFVILLLALMSLLSRKTEVFLPLLALSLAFVLPHKLIIVQILSALILTRVKEEGKVAISLLVLALITPLLFSLDVRPFQIEVVPEKLVLFGALCLAVLFLK